MKGIGRGGREWDKEEEGKGKGRRGKEASTPLVFSNTLSLIFLEISPNVPESIILAYNQVLQLSVYSQLVARSSHQGTAGRQM
jgi:hypothetical protein